MRRGEHKFNIFDMRVLQKMFGSKREEETGVWRKQQNGELHNIY
jgi:hypothetical protein